MRRRRSLLWITTSMLLAGAACADGGDDGAEGDTDAEQQIDSEDLVPADQAESRQAVQGVVGGDFVELVESDDQVLHVRIDSIEDLPGSIEQGGVIIEFNEPVILLTLRIENRTTSDSDGLQFITKCSNRDTSIPLGYDTTVDAFLEPVPGGSFVEGTMLLQYPEDCEGARISAGYFVGSVDADEGSWPLG